VSAPVAIVVLGPSGLLTARTIKAALAGSQIHGLASRVPDCDVSFEKTVDHLADLFGAGTAIIGLCASGILIRALGSHLANKQEEPPVIAVAENGSTVVPLLGGHHGANQLARDVADSLGVAPAITTGGDVRFGVALDAPPPGWVLANPEHAKDVMASLLAGAHARITGDAPWLRDSQLPLAEDGEIELVTTHKVEHGSPSKLVYHPKSLALGVGCERGCEPEDLIALVEKTLSENNLAPGAIALVASLDLKADEAAMHVLAGHFGVSARFFSVDDLNAEVPRLKNPSDVVLREVGCPGVAEGAALASVGAEGSLIVEKTKSRCATCAIALAEEPIHATSLGRARGHLAVVGIGPGGAAWRSAEAVSLLRAATDWVGYGLYLDLVSDLAHETREHRFDLGKEEVRVRHALELAGEGRDVALVCSGDAGIYAMASLVFELLDTGSAGAPVSDAARRVEVTVAPGISALQAAAARAGAPLGHDFCAISLSDLLTPWEVIERRLDAAADGDFVVAFYNPKSRRRKDQLAKAIAILRARRPGTTPVIIAASLGRPEERVTTTDIDAFDSGQVDMLSLVIVGSSATRNLTTTTPPRIYTPRGYEAKEPTP
jgi:cobalt-precorrin 5A hydrolase / cobalt-factor III methyltransferase / precorrin-3B C17-methyltransferase